MKTNTIRGRVIDIVTGKGIAGLRVEFWSVRKDASAPLATTNTRKNGSFELSIPDPAVLEEIREILLKIYQDGQLLKGPYLELVYRVSEWEATMVIEVEGVTTPSGTSYSVQGTVSEPDGAPAAGVTVKISAQQLRSATLLGEATTDSNGQYTLQYTAKSAPDLSAAVYGNDNTLLYQSTTNTLLYNAPKKATLNITLTTSSVPQPIEFDTILNALTPLVGGVPFYQLGQTTQYQDITYLAGQTGIDATYLTYFVLSYKVQNQFQILPSFTYAILREGALQNTNLSQPLSLRTTITVNADVTGLTYDMALLSTDTLQTAVTTATQNFIIDDISQQVPGILSQLAQLQAAAQQYVQQTRPQQLLNQVSSALSSGSYKELINVLSTNYYGNIPALYNAVLAANPLNSTTAPAGGTDNVVPLSAVKLAGTDAHAIFMTEFEKDDQSPFSNKAKMLEALKNRPDVDLGKGNIDVQLKQPGLHEETKKDLRKLQRLYKLVPNYQQAKALHQDGIHSAAQIAAKSKKSFIKKYTQNKTFTPAEAEKVYERATVAHTAALELAGQLRDYASLGKWKSLGGPAVYAKLQAVNQNFPNYSTLFQGLDYCECQACNNVWSPAAYLVDVLDFLGNREVIGGTDTARTILFDRRPDLGDLDLNCNNTNTEVPYIDLVCEILEQAVAPDPGLNLDSSYTADLVPGAIDTHLLTALQGAGYNITSVAIIYPSYMEGAVTCFIIRDTMITLKVSQTGTGWNARELHQTHLTSAELLAYPEYVNTAAYNLLQTAEMAFTLPFDLYQEESESLLSTVNIQRSALMAALQAPAGLTEASIAAVALGIPPTDANLITTPNATNQYVYWNVTAGSLPGSVAEVDVFLLKSGLAYTDLQNLLSLDFINPTGNIYIKHEDSSCNPAKKVLEGLDLNGQDLDRMHRFIRLWNKTGLSMVDLDRVISYPDLGNGTLGAPVLVYLYSLQNLENTLGITLDQALSFYGLMPDLQQTDLYQTTWLNLATTNPIDPAFMLTSIEANEALPPGSQDTLANHLSTLCLCLRLSATNVNLIIQQLSTLSGVANPALTRANLAFVYSNSLLASSLGMALQDMYNLITLSGQTLFTSPVANQYTFVSPDSTNAFIQLANFVLNSSFAVSDLEWFLTGQDPTGTRTISNANITTFLTALQTAYQSVYASTGSTFQAGATPTENLNGLKQMLGQLPGISAGSINQVISVINNTYSVTSPTAQQLMQNIFGAYFAPSVTTLIQTDVTNLIAASGSAATQNTLIGDLSTNTSLYLYTNAKISALYSAADSIFGTADPITQALLNNGASQTFLAGATNLPALIATLTSDSMVDKVNTPPQPPVITPAAFPQQFQATMLVNMMVAYYNKINVTAHDLQWFLENNGTMGWLPLSELCYQSGASTPTFASWVSFQQALQLMTQFPPISLPTVPPTPMEWTDVWNQLLGLTGNAALQAALVQFTNWDPVAVGALCTYFNYAYPTTVAGIAASPFAQPSTYLQLSQTTGYLSLLGIPLSSMTQIITPALGATQAGIITQALRNQYSETQWLSVIQPVMNALRPQKRDALVDYLLAISPTMQSTDDLFDYFLVDVEMQPGTPSSRIVLAHGTVQLFIQRCLLGLEPNATADITDDNGWSQWSAWMNEYQVWSANRQIFLYPENWFDPSLRSNMSPFFSDFMNTLQQNQVNEANVESAAITYLSDLDGVGNLDVRACYYDVNTFIFHVIARVRGSNSYYYRTCTNENSWSAWTEVNVDISGDCLLAFVRNNRLYLAWPLFTEYTQQSSTLDVPSAGSSVTVPSVAPQKQYQVQLATSQYVNGNWQPKTVSQQYLTTDFVDGDLLPPLQDSLRMINFDLGSAGDNIVCTFNDTNGYPYTIGTFSLTGCQGYPVPVSWSDSMPDYEIIPQFEYTDFEQMQYQQVSNPGSAGLIARTILNPFAWRNILADTPSLYEVVYPHEFSLLDYIYLLAELLLGYNSGNYAKGDINDRGLVLPMASFMPFFFQDSDRDYVIIPGFYGTDGQTGAVGQTSYTFSGIYTFVENVIAFIKKYLQIYEANPGMSLLTLITEVVNDPEYKTLIQQWQFFSSTQPQFMFQNFYHPLICTIKTQVYMNGLPSIYSYSFQSQQTSFDFKNTYGPSVPPYVPSVAQPYPVENIDFSSSGSYSLYNWEIFYDLPFYVGNQLSASQQFQDAQNWYNYIFNPTGGQGGTSPSNYWITKPFHEFTTGDYTSQRIDTILTDIAADPSGATITSLVNAVNNWRENPFMPDVVCSTRQVGYAKAIFIAYINNLIAWGDYLFTQDTTETRVQATQLYILADELMGPQPESIPTAVPVPDQTYNQMLANIDVFGNALVDLENLVPNLNILPQKGAEIPSNLSLLYFCIPPNSTLTTLWSTIADRLYKLRNSEDINGNYVSVPLFAPPINPGLLVRAVAEGASIGSILAGLNAPLPYYRFRVMSAKATELATQVSNLGNALLSALEKKDAEMLSQLRASQEVALQTQILQIRNTQVTQANQSITELQTAQAISQAKYNYYSSRPFMNGWEITQATLVGVGIISQIAATVIDAVAGGVALVPFVSAGAAGIGGSPLVTVGYGGGNVADSSQNFATLFKDLAGILQTSAGLVGNIGSYQRRMDDWNFLSNQATLEIADYSAKITVAQTVQQIATQEVSAQQTRINQATAMQTAIQTKFTNEQLYSWMSSQISAVYYQAYQLAYAVAMQAQQCYQYELAVDNTFIQFGYWNGGQKGLLAGDQLLASIKQMESSYLNTNKREYELTKNISLLSLNPQALIQLINTGSCNFAVPEFLFDMDYPGQYLRRLKTVAVTIPCVAGPMTTVACTLTLVSNQYRLSPLPAGGSDPYFETPVGGDPRFIYNTGFVQAIALSSAQNDDGLFELRFDDERYLPFEGMGAIGTWNLQMNDPDVFAQFDYTTITDIILQVKYTSRNGGSQLRSIASSSLQKVLKSIADQTPPAGLFRAFDLHHDFPNNWYAFMTSTTGTYSLTLTKTNFPFYTQNSATKLSIRSATLFVETSSSGILSVSIQGAAADNMAAGGATFGAGVQYLDITNFTPILKLASDSATFTAAFSSFASVSGTITGAWLILNYDLVIP